MQAILEVAIGLVLTIGVIAVVVSSTMELISAVTRMRARTLEKGIARLLDNRRSEPVPYFGWLGLRKPVASTAVTQVVLQHPLIQALSSPRATDRPPAYIDAVTFASALLGSSLPTSSLIVKVLEDGAALDTKINGLPDAEPGKTVKAAWTTASKDPTKLVELLLADGVNGRAGIALLVDPPSVDARIAALAAAGDVAASVLAGEWHDAQKNPDTAASSFIAALEPTDLLTRAKQGGIAVTHGVAQIKAANPYLGTSLENLWTRAASDVTKFRKEVEDWFDREMARVSGWYTRWAQWIMIIVALVIVLALNVSAVTVGKALWTDPTLRTTAADAAAQITSTTTATTTAAASSDSTITPATTAHATAPEATVAPAPPANSQTLKGIGLPIGWNDTAWPGLDWYLVLHLLGIILVAIAASFGAPFWFDLLNRLVNLRAGGKPPPTAADQRASQTSG